MTLKIAITEARSFAELRPIIDNTGYGLSCLGGRYIFAAGYNGTVSIDALAAKVIELVNQYKFQFTKRERNHGLVIADRISRIYELSDLQVRQQGFLIRLFVFLRSIPTSFGGHINLKCCLTRWYWEKCDSAGLWGVGTCYNKVFEYYTRNQYYYIWHFGRTPKESHRFEHPEPEKMNEIVDCWC